MEIEVRDMVGLGTDGASSMMGKHNSLQALLKKEVPHLLHNRCANHAIDLAARDAVRRSMPSNVDHW